MYHFSVDKNINLEEMHIAIYHHLGDFGLKVTYLCNAHLFTKLIYATKNILIRLPSNIESLTEWYFLLTNILPSFC